MHCLRACLFLTVKSHWRASHKTWLDCGKVFLTFLTILIFLHVNCILVVIANPILYINQNNKGKSHTSHSSIKQPTVWASFFCLRTCNFLVLKLLGFFFWRIIYVQKPLIIFLQFLLCILYVTLSFLSALNELAPLDPSPSPCSHCLFSTTSPSDFLRIIC